MIVKVGVCLCLVQQSVPPDEVGTMEGLLVLKLAEMPNQRLAKCDAVAD